MRIFRSLLGALALALVLSRPAHAQGVKLVANAASSITSLSKDEVSRIFLKKVTVSGGAAVVPVDQSESSPVRRAFSKELLGRDVSAVVTFWQQQIFAGRGTPPLQRPGDAEVLNYVRATPNAIGYVAAGTDAGPGVRVITISN